MNLRIERVVVTGGRKFTDGERIEADLRALLPLGLRRVAEGGAAGADRLAFDAWSRVHASEYPDAHIREGPTYRANWGLYGPSAGLRRNIEMLEAEKPVLVLAYPDPESRGTWHCVREAVTRNIPVFVWHDGVVVTHAHIDSQWYVFPSSTPTEIDKRHGLLARPPPGYPLDKFGEDMAVLMHVLAGGKVVV